MTIKVVFDVVRVRNLCAREGWLDKANAEVRSEINKRVYNIMYAEDQGQELKKVVLLIGKYTTKIIDVLEVAKLIVWHCTHVNVVE